MEVNQKSVTMRALLIEKDEGWIAQCLDYDLVAQAEFLPDLLKELQRLLISHVAVSLELDREPFAGFTPAPQVYWDIYERVGTRWRMEADDGDFDHPSINAPHLNPLLKVIHARELEAVH